MYHMIHMTTSDVVKNDVGVRLVADDWYSSVQWRYFNDRGDIQTEEGAYLSVIMVIYSG